MELHEAYQAVDQAVSDGLVPDDLLELLDTPDDEKLVRAMRYKKIATALGLWECAEVLYDDPAIQKSPFSHTREEIFSFLGIEAAEYEDYDRAREYFAKSDLDEQAGESLITYTLINQDKLDLAVAAIRKVDFSYIDMGMGQRNLGNIVHKLCKQSGGPKNALDLVIDLVPNPEMSDIEDKAMEHSRLDYFLEPIAPAAIAENDFDTAEKTVELTNNWFGPGAAMGGGGLLDYAIEAEDPSVRPAIITLIFRKWAAGNLYDQLIKSHDSVRAEVRLKIAEWLDDIKSKNYDELTAQKSRDILMSNIDELVVLYSH